MTLENIAIARILLNPYGSYNDCCRLLILRLYYDSREHCDCKDPIESLRIYKNRCILYILRLYYNSREHCDCKDPIES